MRQNLWPCWDEKKRRVKIVIEGENIEQVPNFNYLGCTTSAIEMNADLEENISNYNKLNGCIKRHFGTSMRQEIKPRLNNLVSKPALKYASETWTLRSRDKQRLEAAQMTFMRSLCGVTRRDRLTNTDLRTQLGEINIVEEIEQYQKKWRERVLRMPPSRYPRQTLFYRPTGRRDLGRPLMRWSDQF
jgi:ribonucleotide reductase alpha subunit